MSPAEERSRPRGHDWLMALLSRGADFCAVLLAGWIAYAWRFDSVVVHYERYQWALLVGGLIQLWLFPLFGLYRSWRGRRWLAMVAKLLAGYLAWGVALAVVMFAFQLFDYSRIWLLGWMLLAFALSTSARGIAYPLITRLRKHGRNQRKVLLIGDASSCRNAFYALRRDPGQGFDVARVLVLDYGLRRRLKKYQGVVDNYEFGRRITVEEEEVWVCLPLSRGNDAHRIIDALDTVTANIRLMPNLSDLRLINHSTSVIAGQHLIDVCCSPMTGWRRMKKRILDVVLSSLILVTIAPLLLILALGVRVSSRGPIFYRQERVSWNGRPFWMLKFRSMHVDTEQSGVDWGGARNKSTTRFGALLRRTSLDELPQFINVLRGDMSIVGPRPERTIFVERFKHEIPGYMQKHMVKAGITGWAQINGWRGDTDLNKRIEYDLWYIENWSLWLDLKIILLTFFRGFTNPHAY